MPVRAIKQIIDYEKGIIAVPIPHAITNAYKIYSFYDHDDYEDYCCDDLFICEFRNHFDKNKNLIHKINESSKLSWCGGFKNSDSKFLKLEEMAQKYGFIVGECLEIIFQAIERSRYEINGHGGWKRRKGTEAEVRKIFPERMVEDLDFAP